MTNKTDIFLTDIPKISLNQWYAGSHWSKRTNIKEQFKWLILEQAPKVRFKGTKVYHVVYHYSFNKKPLDVTNCVAMTKIIEDILFEDDKPSVIPFVATHVDVDRNIKGVNCWIEVYEL